MSGHELLERAVADLLDELLEVVGAGVRTRGTP
jgi:hypothetical protein